MKKKGWLQGFWLLLLLFATCAAQADPPPGKGYRPVFQDEFNGTTLDTGKWNYNYPWGTTHNGMANMQPAQVTVANGILTLTAIPERTIWNPWGYWDGGFNKYISFDYTAGTIHTHNLASWRYGYIEGRFKMPWQESTWPAFWMLQEGWPPELDILEVQGNRYRTFYNYHYRDGSGNHTSFGGEYWGPNLSDDFHTYGVEWTPTNLDFYFDGVKIRSFYAPDAIAQMGPMYLIINLQIGGWAPDPIASEYPARYQCDWVRIWQIGGPPTGVYRITPRHATDKSLEVNGFNTANGASVDIYSAGYGQNSLWSVERQNDGSYKIRSYPDWNWLDRVLDVNGYNTANGASISLWDDNGGDNQRWFFEDTGDGWWRIVPKIAPLKSLDIAGQSNANGARAWLWDDFGGDNQRWRMDPPYPVSTVSGTLTLQGLEADASAQTVTFVFRPADNSGDISHTVAVSPAGTYQITNLPRKAYTLHVKGAKWLAKNLPVDARNGDVSNVRVTLPGGDANGDNSADALDLAVLIDSFNTTSGDTLWNSAADFNGDNFVDALDLAILIDSFNTEGDS